VETPADKRITPDAGELLTRSIKVAGWPRQTRSGVAGVAGLFHETLQALGFEVDGFSDNREMPAPFVQLIVVGANAFWMPHVLIIDAPMHLQQSAESRNVADPGSPLLLIGVKQFTSRQ
jgi:hypothetical protein